MCFWDVLPSAGGSAWLLRARPKSEPAKNQLLLARATKSPVSKITDAKAVVKGVVSDEKGNTLPGATVSVKGMQMGTSTNVDGEYSIDMPAGANVLVFSFIGMATQEVEVGSRTTINVVLAPADRTLDEVVVIGYGTSKRADVTSSITTVKAADIKDIPAAGIDQLLQGKAAGVTVTSKRRSARWRRIGQGAWRDFHQ